jgi:hypothetical protein
MRSIYHILLLLSVEAFIFSSRVDASTQTYAWYDIKAVAAEQAANQLMVDVDFILQERKIIASGSSIPFEKRTGEDVILTVSVDGGQTWHHLKVFQDPGDGKHRFSWNAGEVWRDGGSVWWQRGMYSQRVVFKLETLKPYESRNPWGITRNGKLPMIWETTGNVTVDARIPGSIANDTGTVPMQAAEKIRHTVAVGLDSGVTVEIVGQDSDIIYIRRNGKLIGSQRIDDHPMTPADVAYTRAEDLAAGSNDWNVAVRSGRDKDVFTCYAVRENNVFNNGGERFRFGQRKDRLRNYGFAWQAETLWISFGSKKGRISWDAQSKLWVVYGEQVPR